MDIFFLFLTLSLPLLLTLLFLAFSFSVSLSLPPPLFFPSLVRQFFPLGRCRGQNCHFPGEPGPGGLQGAGREEAQSREEGTIIPCVFRACVCAYPVLACTFSILLQKVSHTESQAICPSKRLYHYQYCVFPHTNPGSLYKVLKGFCLCLFLFLWLCLC